MEGLTIVGSILLAFAIDAWWDSNRDQRDARELVAALSDELVATREHLDLVEVAATGRIDVIRKALVSPAEIGALPRDQVGAALMSVMAPMTFDPSRGALTALLSGGALEKIEDSELRAAISALPGALDDIDEEGELLVENMHQLQARMAELGATSKVFLTLSGDAKAGQGLAVLVELIADDMMREHLAEAAIGSSVMLDELYRLRARIDELIEWLDRY